MKTQVSDCLDVKSKARTLDCSIPIGITVLPYNFEDAETKDDLCYEGVAQVIKDLFQENNIPETPLEQEGERFPSLFMEGGIEDWIGPTIFVSFAILSENPSLISVALNVISNYLTDWFKDASNRKPIELNRATLDIVIESKDGTCKKLNYDGPGADLGRLAKVIKEIGFDD